MTQVFHDKPVTVLWAGGHKSCERIFPNVREAAAFVVDGLPSYTGETAVIEGPGMRITDLQEIAELHRTGKIEHVRG